MELPFLMQSLFGKMFVDKEYISELLFERLFVKDFLLITGVRKNMKNRLMNLNKQNTS